MFKGTSSSPSASRVAGSGIGPSITHLFDSYFVRMKFSIFASEGIWVAASLASQYLFARELPHRRMLCSCSSVQESKSTDLIRLIWVPIPRCMPEQRMQTKTPRFQLAQRGCLLRLQSAQILLPSSFSNALIVCWFCAARSAGAATRRDIAESLNLMGGRKRAVRTRR